MPHTIPERDETFYKRADEHIALANSHINTQQTKPVDANDSLLYATARFNAWIVAASFTNPEEMKKAGLDAYLKAKQHFDNWQAQDENLNIAIKFFGIAIENLEGFKYLPEYEKAYKYKQEAEILQKEQITPELLSKISQLNKIAQHRGQTLVRYLLQLQERYRVVEYALSGF